MFGNTSSPFGQKPATPGFGGLTQPTFGSPGTSAFGTPQQSNFGQSTPAPTFGQATPAPAFGQATATPTFGQGTSTPGFGLGTPATPSFGQPSATPAFGQTSSTPGFTQQSSTPLFGQTSAAPAFGQTTTTPNFNQPTVASTPAPAFGQPANPPAFGQTTTGFGAPTSQPSFSTPATTTSGFTAPGTSAALLSFGTPQQKVSFGTTTTIPAATPAAQPTLNFGTPAAPATSTQASGFQFGTTTTQSGFGTLTSSAPALGTVATTTSQPLSLPQTTTSLTFSLKPGGPTLSLPTTTTQASISFGAATTAKPTTTTASLTQPSVTGLSSFTSCGLSSLGSAIGGKSMLTITGNTATTLYSNKTADLQAGRSQGQVPPKCQDVPPMIMELIESFKKNLEAQKHMALEVSRASSKPISKVSSNAESIKRSVLKLERAVNKNKLLDTKLKEETVKALADVEVAQKAMDIPGGFPSDNSIITDYFIQLATKFQQHMLSLRVELESTEKSVLCELNPVAFTPQELSLTMQRLYECFVALAGRFQFVHAQISNLKVQYLELRKQKLGDYTDIFNKRSLTFTPREPIGPLVPGGPTPFAGMKTISSVMNSLGYPTNDIVISKNVQTPNPMNTSFFNQSFNKSFQNNNIMSPNQLSATPGSKRGKR